MDNIYDLIIIGAGISGLHAANILKDKKILIIEASASIGGRIKYLEINNNFINLGARWINKTYKVPKMFRKLDLIKTSFRFSNTDIQIYTNSGILNYDWTGLNQSLNYLIKNRLFYKNLSIRDALKSLGWKPKTFCDQIALWFLVEFEWGFSYDSMGIPKNNNDSQWYIKNSKHLLSLYEIPRHLLKLNEKVLSVKENNANQVIIRTTKNNYITKSVILTTSINVIKSNQIKFVPKLPNEKLQVLNKYDFMAIYEVIVVEFEEMFWSDVFNNKQCILYGSDDVITLIHNLYSYHKLNLLEFHFTNHVATRIQNKQYSQNLVRKIILDVFKIDNPKIIKLHTTNWCKNSLTLGSFTTEPLGITRKEKNALIRPHMNGKLIFSGEGFNFNHTGYIQSALQSI